MSPTVRSRTRSPTLAAALSHGQLRLAWKNTVRHGLRRQGLADLHDYLDVHRRLPLIVTRIHNEVVAGTYRPREPEFVSVEKKLGITRRVVIPSPEDAIILQALVDGIEKPILEQQPSPDAFYSRSHAPPTVYDIDSSFPYPWWELWPEFQARIWAFARECPFVAVTDLANYFDSIPLKTLRNRLVSIAHLREELVDFLFFLLEQMGWRPDYVPNSGVGLPQIQFDAPRLLAHAYLFEADDFLQHHSLSSMVRWMDDINIGVSSIEDGKKVLRDLDEMLAAMGLRLNTGKSQILSGREMLSAMWVAENRRLNGIDKILDTNPAKARSRSIAAFGPVWRGTRQGAWGKIVRRYFTVFTRLKDPFLERYVPSVLADLPGVRDKVIRYYTVLGYSARRFRQIEDYLKSGACIDEWSLYSCLQLLVSWAIPLRSPYQRRALSLSLEVHATRRENHVATAGVIGVWAKYATPRALHRLILSTSRTWRRSDWAARQVAAVTPVLGVWGAAIYEMIAGYGLRDGMEVLFSLRQIRRLEALDNQLKSYLFQPRGDYPYPFAKILTSIALLNGRLADPDRTRLLEYLRTETGDPSFVRLVSVF
ncbi:RNA-directed DNA polymerase [Gemmatimonadota bacterium]